MRSGGKKHKRSEPGQPIRWHQRPGFKDRVFTAYDLRSRSQLTGPSAAGRSKLARVLEEGGIITVKTVEDGKIVRKRYHYRPRPTMQLALENSLPKLKEFLRDVIT